MIQCNNVQVYSLIQATLSSELMSAVVAMDCWDMLVTAADTCCIQLLHDANNSLYIAVGCTLHSFSVLERILLSLLTSLISTDMAAKPQPDTDDLNPQWKTSLQACTVDAEPLLETGLQQVSDDSNVDRTESEAGSVRAHEQFTRSGRRVKSKNFTDFVSSDMTGADCTVQRRSSVDKTSVMRRQAQPTRQPSPPAPAAAAASVTECDAETGVIRGQPQDLTPTSSGEQTVNEFCQQQSHETAACDQSSDLTIENGIVFFLSYDILYCSALSKSTKSISPDQKLVETSYLKEISLLAHVTNTVHILDQNSKFNIMQAQEGMLTRPDIRRLRSRLRSKGSRPRMRLRPNPQDRDLASKAETLPPRPRPEGIWLMYQMLMVLS